MLSVGRDSEFVNIGETNLLVVITSKLIVVFFNKLFFLLKFSYLCSDYLNDNRFVRRLKMRSAHPSGQLH